MKHVITGAIMDAVASLCPPEWDDSMLEFQAMFGPCGVTEATAVRLRAEGECIFLDEVYVEEEWYKVSDQPPQMQAAVAMALDAKEIFAWEVLRCEEVGE